MTFRASILYRSFPNLQRNQQLSYSRFLTVGFGMMGPDTPTWVKNHSCYDALRTYGAIAA